MTSRTTFNSLEWNENLAQLIDHIGDDDFPTLLADTIQRLSPYNSLVIHSITGMTKPELLFHNLPDEFIESSLANYCDGPYILDPVTQACQHDKPSCLTHLSDLIPSAPQECNFKQSEYHKRYYKKTGLRDESTLIIKLSTEHYITHSIGYRSGDIGAIGKRDLQRLHTAAPALISICKKHWNAYFDKTEGVQKKPALNTSAHSPIEDISSALNNFGGKMLTKREHQVASMMLRGYPGKTIAKELYISPETVKVHRRRINNKLGVSSHAQLFTLFINFLSGKSIPLSAPLPMQSCG